MKKLSYPDVPGHGRASVSRAARTGWSAVAFAVFCSILLCSTGHGADQRAPLPAKLAAWCDSLSVDRQAHVSATHALFQIIDPRYTKKQLERANSFTQFESRISEWSKANPALWLQFNSRLDSCNALWSAGRLGTSIDAVIPDSRWELFIKYGQPTNTLVLPCACANGVAACSIWTCTWVPPAADSSAFEVSCQSHNGESYPTRIVPNDKVGFPSACPIWPIVNVSRFASDSGGVDLWFSLWVQGDQFSRATLDGSVLTMTVELFDSTRSRLVARAASIANLQIIRGVLEATERQYRRLIRAMGYVGLPGIAAGRYFAEVQITGARNNEGSSWVEISVPAEVAVCDLLLLDRSAGNAKNLQTGIIRGSQERLYDNPEAAYLRGTKLELYAEAALPKPTVKEYSVWVTLLALPEIVRKAKGTVNIGEAAVVADSLDQPVTEGKWQTPEDLKILEERATYSPDTKAITLLRKQFAAKDNNVVVEVDARLPADLRPGRYLLTMTLSDPESQRYFLSVRRVITVVSPARSKRLSNR